jgi:hypothetical protein
VIGRIGEHSMRIRMRPDPGFRNSFQLSLHARFVESGDGTVIRFRFGFHPFVVVFLCLWFGMLILICLAVIAPLVRALVAGDTPPVLPLNALGVPLGMLAVGFGLVAAGRSLSSGDREELLDFLKSTVSARPTA